MGKVFLPQISLKEAAMGTHNWAEITGDLSALLRLKSTPVGIKFFQTKEELNSIPKIRYADKRFAVCMLIGQAVYNNWTVAVLPEYLHADYCKTIHGMFGMDDRFRSGKMFLGAWHADASSAWAHHNALTVAEHKYEAMAVSPLSLNRIPEPDVCLMYITPGQLFMLLAGYVHSAYEKLDFTFAGESTCSDSWVRTLVTGKPSAGIPCFAERKFGGVQDEEMSLALSPAQLERAIAGAKALAKNGLRYPIPPYGISCDMLAGLPKSYLDF
jgi:uncharacterized protein (DUF169 family)